MVRSLSTTLPILVLLCGHVRADDIPTTDTVPASDTSLGDGLVTDYFRMETQKLTERAFAEIKTLEDWTSQREGYRQQLLEMLGLDPLPTRTPLEAVVTGTVREGDVVVERIHFQSRPGLYVTGNFYRPGTQKGPLPAVLYVCGHARAKENGISLGNKTKYQHHG
ncbi:MAG: acetylxylan esterase, partial [Pirellulaceae bacterium]|nr:acetylxylan esterase [Pirellulaceae bacterium]